MWAAAAPTAAETSETQAFEHQHLEVALALLGGLDLKNIFYDGRYLNYSKVRTLYSNACINVIKCFCVWICMLDKGFGVIRKLQKSAQRYLQH